MREFTDLSYQPCTIEYKEEDGCKPIEISKELRKLREQLERLERTVATLRRKVYNG